MLQTSLGRVEVLCNPFIWIHQDNHICGSITKRQRGHFSQGFVRHYHQTIEIILVNLFILVFICLFTMAGY